MKARSKSMLLVAICGAAAVAGCAPSPLYVSSKSNGTHGEIPRDGYGEPLWSAIPQAQPEPIVPEMPVGTGIPVTPPPQG